VPAIYQPRRLNRTAFWRTHLGRRLPPAVPDSVPLRASSLAFRMSAFSRHQPEKRVIESAHEQLTGQDLVPPISTPASNAHTLADMFLATLATLALAAAAARAFLPKPPARGVLIAQYPRRCYSYAEWRAPPAVFAHFLWRARASPSAAASGRNPGLLGLAATLPILSRARKRHDIGWLWPVVGCTATQIITARGRGKGSQHDGAASNARSYLAAAPAEVEEDPELRRRLAGCPGAAGSSIEGGACENKQTHAETGVRGRGHRIYDVCAVRTSGLHERAGPTVGSAAAPRTSRAPRPVMRPG
jgi:hypothetical protein